MTVGRIRRLTLSPLLVAVAWPTLAAAQTVPPAGATPPTREELERAAPAPSERDRAPALTVSGELERAPCPLADPQFAGISFTLNQVQFNGLQGLSPDLLREAYAGQIGQTLSIASVCEIRDRAATILRGQGYLAAVQVPPQRIEGGVVTFDVLMARLVAIQVRGNAGRSERVVAGYLDKIRNQSVFNIRDAERYLLLARDLPGLDVRLTLRPAGGAPGEVIGEVSVVHTPVEMDINLQNFGSRETGRFGGLARVQFNGLTGMGDRTTLGVFTTADFREQQVVQAGHAFRVGKEGLTIGGDFTYAGTKPDIAAFNLRSETLVATLDASYPLLRSQAKNLFGSVGFDMVNQEVRFAGTPLTRDRLRVIYARLAYDSIDARSIASTRGYSIVEPRWRAGGMVELRQGLDIFGARDCGAAFANCAPPSPSLSRAEGDATAFVARASAAVEYRPMPTLAFILSPRAQYAPNPLLSYEEFSAGNYTTGRGFDPGALTGDSGLGFQSEIRVGSIVPKSREGFAIQPFGFFDLGLAWNEDSAFAGRGAEHLYSAGGGIHAAYGDRARLDVTLAAPLNRTALQAKRGDMRLLVSLTAKLLPWNR
ncbi:MAG: hemin transporter [Sphingomonas sp. SCN 67-18]|uniref:ShlB/FhaC/HecB family hemolysin secretion/activation protein n=1 Tax=uncultured Sphingomonas sp. TaxID=158754 RepID=UPI000868CCCF|nr:ShlB/FhaC/HecB family hemolysin secretion/activation protein [Sphingomonas sp. SCN 67-18]ODU21031.1 MAG: hemin transporter [Sphingomonas sp. SCN 67-18]